MGQAPGNRWSARGLLSVFVDWYGVRMDTIEASRGNWGLQFLVPSLELMGRRRVSGTE